jgi:hypothetical protein
MPPRTPVKKPVTRSKVPKKSTDSKSRKPAKKTGGSLVTDLSKLAVPFGLMAAKNSLEMFINKSAQQATVSKRSVSPKAKKTPSPKKKSPSPKSVKK